MPKITLRGRPEDIVQFLNGLFRRHGDGRGDCAPLAPSRLHPEEAAHREPQKRNSKTRGRSRSWATSPKPRRRSRRLGVEARYREQQWGIVRFRQPQQLPLCPNTQVQEQKECRTEGSDSGLPCGCETGGPIRRTGENLECRMGRCLGARVPPTHRRQQGQAPRHIVGPIAREEPLRRRGSSPARPKVESHKGRQNPLRPTPQGVENMGVRAIRRHVLSGRDHKPDDILETQVDSDPSEQAEGTARQGGADAQGRPMAKCRQGSATIVLGSTSGRARNAECSQEAQEVNNARCFTPPSRCLEADGGMQVPTPEKWMPPRSMVSVPTHVEVEKV